MMKMTTFQFKKTEKVPLLHRASCVFIRLCVPSFVSTFVFHQTVNDEPFSVRLTVIAAA